MKRQLGFTLIEMALVVAIMGLLVGGGVVAIGPLVDKAHQNTTFTNMDQIEAALVLFTIRNNRLPCPADGSVKSSGATYGLENRTAAAPYNCTNSLTTSVIPWRSLGLDENYSLDGWGNRVSYFPSDPTLFSNNALQSLVDNDCAVRNVTSGQSPSRPGYVAATSICDPTTIGALSVAGTDPPLTQATLGQPLIPSYPWGNYLAVSTLSISTGGVASVGSELTQAEPTIATITNTAPGTFNQAGQRAAYVLVSHGKSSGCAWNKSGSLGSPGRAGVTCTTAGSSTFLKSYNYNGSATVTANGATVPGFIQSNQIVSNTSAYFDDIVRWRSPAFIIQNCGSGSCGNP